MFNNLHFKLLLVNIGVALSLVEELLGIILAFGSLGVIPTPILSPLNAVIAYLPMPHSTVTITSGEGVIIGIIVMFWSYQMFDKFMDGRKNIIEEIEAELPQ